MIDEIIEYWVTDYEIRLADLADEGVREEFITELIEGTR